MFKIDYLYVFYVGDDVRLDVLFGNMSEWKGIWKKVRKLMV
jgi:hypothetical protein